MTSLLLCRILFFVSNDTQGSMENCLCGNKIVYLNSETLIDNLYQLDWLHRNVSQKRSYTLMPTKYSKYHIISQSALNYS